MSPTAPALLGHSAQSQLPRLPGVPPPGVTRWPQQPAPKGRQGGWKSHNPWVLSKEEVPPTRLGRGIRFPGLKSRITDNPGTTGACNAGNLHDLTTHVTRTGGKATVAGQGLLAAGRSQPGRVGREGPGGRPGGFPSAFPPLPLCPIPEAHQGSLGTATSALEATPGTLQEPGPWAVPGKPTQHLPGSRGAGYQQGSAGWRPDPRLPGACCYCHRWRDRHRAGTARASSRRGLGPGSLADSAPLHPSSSTPAALPGPHSPQLPGHA